MTFCASIAINSPHYVKGEYVITTKILKIEIEAVRALHERLQEWLIQTPIMRCRALENCLGGSFEIHAKLEFLQRTGTF